MTSRDRQCQGTEQRLLSPWRLNAFGQSVALCRITQRLMRQRGVAPLMNQFREW